MGMPHGEYERLVAPDGPPRWWLASQISALWAERDYYRARAALAWSRHNELQSTVAQLRRELRQARAERDGYAARAAAFARRLESR